MDTQLAQKIEAQRIELEASIAKLRKSLHHWTTLELDYEGLKDEFQVLREGATGDHCLNTAHGFGPQQLNEKELSDLIFPSRGKTRSPTQIVELLSKRIEYVLRNAESLKKQISDLERKRNAVLLAAHPEHEAEASLPLAEITEELDDNDNVLSSKVQQQGNTAKRVLDVLEKTKSPTAEVIPQHGESLASPPARIEELDSSDEDAESTTADPAPHTKGVKRDVPQRLIEEPSSQASEDYLLNPDDTEEEAKLRQEMIQYGLGEFGNIVAELEMAEAGDGGLSDEEEEMVNEVAELEEDSFDDGDDESMDDEDSEDETGRSRSAVHTEKYRSHIEDLQKQLGFRIENVGPSPGPTADPEVKDQINYLRDSDFKDHIEHLPPEFRKRFGRPSPAEAARKAAIAREEALRNASKPDAESGREGRKEESGKKKKKQVAFATTVNIAPKSSTSSAKPVDDAMMANSVIKHQPAELSTPAKVSRFKAARSSHSVTPESSLPSNIRPMDRDDRSGPVGKTIAQTLVERPGSKSAEDAPAPDSDDFDEELQKRQIAVEHHRLRNRMVHQQGGYVKGGEADNWGDAYAAPEIEDDSTGEPIKISRFKAARMRP